MKIFVKTLKGKHFHIEVKPEDTVGDVKKTIESVQGANVYPASRQMLIYQGKELTDGTTLEENKVAENSFIVVMLLKSKSLSGETSVVAVATPASKGFATPESPIVEASTSPPTTVNSASTPASTPASMPTPDSLSVEASTTLPTTVTNASPPTAKPTSLPTHESPVEASITPSNTVTNASPPASMPTSLPAPKFSSSVSKSDADGQAASDYVAGDVLEDTIQHILDIGGGIWERLSVVRALHAASNDPERAVEYLFSGVPKQAEVLSLSQSIGAGQPANTSSVSQQPTLPASLPSRRTDAGPLNIFPPGFTSLGSGAAPSSVLDFLRNSEQFQALRAMVQANPQVLQPMLQELGKQNPNLIRLIQEHQTDFHRLLNEPVEGNVLEQFAAAMPHAIQVTPEEHAAIERLEAMGFDRSTVLEVYFACNKNEELTANYLIDHLNEFDD